MKSCRGPWEGDAGTGHETRGIELVGGGGSY